MQTLTNFSVMLCFSLAAKGICRLTPTVQQQLLSATVYKISVLNDIVNNVT